MRTRLTRLDRRETEARGVWRYWELVTAWCARPAVVKAMAIAAVPLLVGLALSPWGQLFVRVDESWPYHRLFWLERDAEPIERGDLVAYRLTDGLADRIEPPEARSRDYVRRGMWYLKRVLGMPGDRVRVEPLPDGRARIWINGTPVGETVGRDRLGQVIETARLAPVIPAGYYYVGLAHPRSFDSRYLGYVPASLIEGRIVPLW